MTYKAFGNQAILIGWPSRIDKKILKDVILFKNKILNHHTEVILEVVVGYSTLTVVYGPAIENIYNEFSTLKALYLSDFSQIKVKNHRWKIPVCYDEKFGIDLQEISKKNKLRIDAIINLHFSQIYTVFFIGFLPGFLYLGGLDEQLFFDRKRTPRLNVKKGSVGIGGMQTGIYPSQSSGGWNIIGNSPISFFNPKSEQPCFAKSGDEIQFYKIKFEEYEQIKNLVEIGSYKLERKIL